MICVSTGIRLVFDKESLLILLGKKYIISSRNSLNLSLAFHKLTSASFKSLKFLYQEAVRADSGLFTFLYRSISVLVT